MSASSSAHSAEIKTSSGSSQPPHADNAVVHQSDAIAASTHERFMRRAIDLAASAVSKGNHPFGALLVRHDPAKGTSDVVLEAENEVHTSHDVTMHAELNLISKACRTLKPEQLRAGDLYLYTSTEPCCMCAGAVYWSGAVSTVVYGCSEQRLAKSTDASKDPITRSIGMDVPCRDVFAKARSKHPGQPAVAVIGPVLEDEAAKQHDAFW